MITQEFPLHTSIGVFNDEQAIASWLWTQTNSKIYAIDYIYLIQHAPFIYTTDVQEVLLRYNAQKNYGIWSYSQNFDELPYKWIETLSLIDSELIKAAEEKKRWQKT